MLTQLLLKHTEEIPTLMNYKRVALWIERQGVEVNDDLFTISEEDGKCRISEWQYPNLVQPTEKELEGIDEAEFQPERYDTMRKYVKVLVTEEMIKQRL
jgi:hypothetical protein